MKRLIIIISFIFFSSSYGKNIYISLAKIPIMSENPQTGLYYKFIQEMNKYYDDGKIIIVNVFPFKRSLYNVVHGKVDAHFPIIRNPNIDNSKLDYIHTNTKVYNVVFVLYSNQKKIDRNNMKNYKIGTDLAHVDLFDFPIIGSTSIENSLKLLKANRLDAWIYVQFLTDLAIKKNGYLNFKRELYGNFDVVFALPKNNNGIETNKILSSILDKMHKDGSIKKIFKDYYNRKFSSELTSSDD